MKTSNLPEVKSINSEVCANCEIERGRHKAGSLQCPKNSGYVPIEKREWRSTNFSTKKEINHEIAIAIEFGYKQCEKGNNLQGALNEYNKIMFK